MKKNLSIAVYMLLHSSNAMRVAPVWEQQNAAASVAQTKQTKSTFVDPSGAMAKQVTERKAFYNKQKAKKYQYDPFQSTQEGALWNNREGETAGTEITRHDDEPVVMGEANMDSSSDSEDETAEDKKNHDDAIRQADSHIQLSQSKKKGKESKKRQRKAKVLHSFAQTGDEDERQAKLWEQRKALQANPDKAFGAGVDLYSNTRDGGAPGQEIDMHDDEPVIMGETNMDSSSDSESESDQTPEDKANYEAGLKRAESRVQKNKPKTSNLVYREEYDDPFKLAREREEKYDKIMQLAHDSQHSVTYAQKATARWPIEDMTEEEIQARRKKGSENLEKAMEQREDGGAHTGQPTVHQPWSLATSYFAQKESKRWPTEDMTEEEIQARRKKGSENLEKAMEQREDGGAHTGQPTVHQPWSLATSYFAQTKKDNIEPEEIKSLWVNSSEIKTAVDEPVPKNQKAPINMINLQFDDEKQYDEDGNEVVMSKKQRNVMQEAMELAQESAHTNDIPIQRSFVFTQDDDDEDKRPHDIRAKEGETKAERRSRLAGVYARGIKDAEEAEHSHNLPIHQPFSLAHTYDHAAIQQDDNNTENVEEPEANLHEESRMSKDQEKEKEKETSQNSSQAVATYTAGTYAAPVAHPSSFAQLNDDDDEDKRPHDIRAKEGETKAERRSRLAGVYARGIKDAEEAEHSHNLPIHQPFSLAHTYDHAAIQQDDNNTENVEEPEANLHEESKMSKDKKKEKETSQNSSHAVATYTSGTYAAPTAHPASFAQLNDDEDNRPHDIRQNEGETKAQRKSRMAGIYQSGVSDAEKAEHSHDIPVHKPFSLSYTYDHVKLQQDGELNAPPSFAQRWPTEYDGVTMTEEEIQARRKKAAENYKKAMEQREDGGAHTGEVQEHTPWSLAITYDHAATQLNEDSMPYIMSKEQQNMMIQLNDEDNRPKDIRQKADETKAQRKARLAGIYKRGVADAEEAEHKHTVPQHQPFSLSYTYDHVATQLDDEDENRPKDIRQKADETKAQRRSRLADVYKRGVADAEDAEHSHNLPVHKPFSLSHTYDHVAAQTEDAEETEEQRKKRLAGVLKRAEAIGDSAEHSHDTPLHKKSTLSYTYDHTNTQLDNQLSYEWGKFNDGVGEPEHVPKETNPSSNPWERTFTPKDTSASRALADENEHTRVVPLPNLSLVQKDDDTAEPEQSTCERKKVAKKDRTHLKCGTGFSAEDQEQAKKQAAAAEHGSETPKPLVKSLLEYNDDVGEPDHVPKETAKNPLYPNVFTPKETDKARKLADASEHTEVVAVNRPKGSKK